MSRYHMKIGFTIVNVTFLKKKKKEKKGSLYYTNRMVLKGES